MCRYLNESYIVRDFFRGVIVIFVFSFIGSKYIPLRRTKFIMRTC